MIEIFEYIFVKSKELSSDVPSWGLLEAVSQIFRFFLASGEDPGVCEKDSGKDKQQKGEKRSEGIEKGLCFAHVRCRWRRHLCLRYSRLRQRDRYDVLKRSETTYSVADSIEERGEAEKSFFRSNLRLSYTGGYRGLCRAFFL
jgi:hypothetical protein